MSAEYSTAILNVIAGLGMFLYGMKLMGDGLQKVAGDKMRGILETLTKTRFSALIVGIIFTGVIQSSNAATVMVVSFVNAGLMNLSQAIGVIFGANIGTTVTGQLLSLDMSKYAPVILLVGVIMVMFMQHPMVKKFGEVIVGFGILFIGMGTMSSAVGIVKDAPLVTSTLGQLSNPFLCVFFGFAVTSILQSSSATVGILIALCGQGVVDIHHVFFMILGCNIGACISAVLTSLSGNKMAKRAACLHLSFNVLGSVLMFIVLVLGSNGVEHLLHIMTEHTCTQPDQMVNGVNVFLQREVANTHTMFKVVQVAVFFFLSPLLIKLSYILIPGEDQEEEAASTAPELAYIGGHNVYNPTTAVPTGICEIVRMGNIAQENMEKAMDALLHKDENLIAEVYQTEITIDYLNTEITNYLVQINTLSLPVADRKMLGGLFHVVNDIERIGDHAENIADFAKTCIDQELTFSEEAVQELKDMLDDTCEILSLALNMFSHNSEEHLQEILDLENEIDDMERQLQNNHIVRLTSDKCQAHAGMIFTDVVSGLERIADHSTNIAFSILKDDPEADKNQEHIEEVLG
ncbi:Na/Pi cotransporter family protein [Jutongia huaianensis]|uniref:Na/Pi cotransporter family protein n=1 Tax=Jutongia huaianensis TaxID=2763668 RepID=A0ABR7N2S2_9FIRM|nr:Na/Pi cotransporter family protein [Jutongia huaianensis]MBC8562924.1 Na/Pi cotransporter family protein [Jutongia huaianensis]